MGTTDVWTDDAVASGLRLLLATVRSQTEREQWRRQGPVRFAREVLGIRLWRGQREAARLISALDERGYPRHRVVAVKSGHGAGKTCLGAVMVCYWLAAGGPGTIVVTSAPTNRQVEKLLWREINRLWPASPVLAALGQPLTRELHLGPDWAAYGFRPREPEQQQLMQGFHARRLRFLVDEANAYPESLYRMIDRCMTGEDSQLVMVGNAIVSAGRFYRAFAEGGAAGRLTISARRHPNVRSGRELIPGAVTRQWIEDFEREYHADEALVRAAIDAEFPPAGSRMGVVPLDWWRAARGTRPRTLTPVVLGLDVARFGDARTVAVICRGQQLAELREWTHRSLAWTADEVHRMAERAGVELIIVDDVGIGGGVTDELRRRGLAVHGFVAGAKAAEPERFANLATEAYWTVRELCEHRVLALADGFPDEEVGVQLSTREYRVRADRLLQLEPKEEYTRRTGLASPDEADAVAMALWAVAQAWRELAAGGGAR